MFKENLLNVTICLKKTHENRARACQVPYNILKTLYASQSNVKLRENRKTLEQQAMIIHIMFGLVLSLMANRKAI